MILRIGTRGSKLALAQSQWIKTKLEARHPGLRVDLIRIVTTGDKILDSPLSKIGGKGLFTKQIEEALLRKRVDLAVHSIKDVPSEVPEGLMLCAFPERENPYDAFVSMEHKRLEELPRGARVGTGSLRRGAQLLNIRPDLEVVPIRGNVDTRLRKLESGDLHAVILAAAGLKRLGLAKRITQVIPPELVLPAIGQGALGLEVRTDDSKTIHLLDFLNHEPTRVTVNTERAFLKKMEGGCQVPLAAHARLKGQALHLQGMVAELDGSNLLRDEIRGEKENHTAIGIALAERLLMAGGDKILEKLYERTG